MTMKAPCGREQLADRVASCIDGNDLRRALAAGEQLNREYPDYAYGWYLSSFALKKARNLPGALAAIERALRLDPADKYRLHQAKCMYEVRDLAGAKAAIAIIRDRTFDDARLHEEVGSLLNLLGDYAPALRHFSRAVELEPGHAEYQYNKAALQRYFGDIAGAEAGFDTVIALKPDEYEAYNARSQMRTQTLRENHIEQLRSVLARTTAPAGVAQLCYALAKEQEDVGDYEGAFASLARGAEAKRRRLRYDVATDLQIMDKIREVYSADRFDGRDPGFDCPDPIFIIGMPRTGTTLVERILCSHSQVSSAGELNDFSVELIRLAQQLPGPSPASRQDFVAATARLDFRTLGESYVRSTRPMRDDRPFFIDKLPFNFLYAGLIHLALPRAKIVNLQRHPMDTCYAVYKQLFKDAYPFSYDLEELARYYIAYDRLMAHWNEAMPGVILTVRYEALVADVEAETHRLLDHCALPWEESCLQFHRNYAALRPRRAPCRCASRSTTPPSGSGVITRASSSRSVRRSSGPESIPADLAHRTADGGTRNGPT